MSKRAATQVEVVNGATTKEEEVDEITEQMDPTAPQARNPHNLDDFLRELHDTSSVQEQTGMPSPSWIKEHLKTKSAAIRYLHDKGHKVKDISKHLGLRYQHVRNVLTTELKRGPNEDWRFSENETRRISPGLDKV
jgi:hypothetical protein